jgi:hypothetical protein
MLRRLAAGLVALALIGAAPAAARTPLFDDDAPLAVTLTAPFPDLVRAARGAPRPYPATLTLAQGAAPPQTFAIQVEARGISRRTLGYCRFPPLALRFDKAEMKGTLFAHQKKLKLVTYCNPAPDYDQHIVLEYLAYRLYNLVTPISFRVRAAEVTYRSSAADPGLTRFGFLIEDINDVADRNGREELTAASHEVSPARLDAEATARATLFEYMIGNLDWEFLAGPPGAGCCHNGRLLAAPGAKAATATAVVPVPYDYDLSGLVDAPYGEPPEGIPISRNTERFYHGYCASKPAMGAVIDEFRARRAAMLALVDAEPDLNAAFRAKAERYLESFFTGLDDPRKVQTEIIDHCR